MNWPRKFIWSEPKDQISDLSRDILEFVRILRWYFGKKFHFLGVTFEEIKGIIVDVLMARRGAYQRTFLRTGLVGLAIFAVGFTPLILGQYPRSVQSASSLDEQSPSAVIKTQGDISTTDVDTKESDKPRRDVVDHVVASGENLSSIAKDYGINVESIKYLNKYTDATLLHPGDTVKIPPVTGVIVTVQSGDTVYSLAKKYSLPTAQPIVDWTYNTFVDDEKFTLAAGQTLVLPGGVPPSEAPVAPVQLQKTPSISSFPSITPGSGSLSWPTTGVITQYFTWYHNGVDIANSIGTAVSAADSGRVVSVLYQNVGYGYHVIVDHGNGYKSLYAHLSKISVNEGDNLSRGQLVGLMGSTGRSTGPHLHFTVFFNGKEVNPLSLLK